MNSYESKKKYSYRSGILYPRNLEKLNKIGKDIVLPDISPSEQRLYIQKPSLIRNFHRPKANLQSFRDLIERSVLNLNGNILESKEPEPQRLSRKKYTLNLKKITIKRHDNSRKFSPFSRFMSTKPLKPRPHRTRSPIFGEQSLMINKYIPNIHLYTSRNRDLSNGKRRYSSDSDEDRIDSKLQMNYFESIPNKLENPT